MCTAPLHQSIDSPSSTVTPSMTTSSARPPRRLRSKLQTQERGGWSSLRGCGEERRPGGGKGASSHCDVRLWKRLTNMVGRAGACHAPSHDRHARVSFRTGGPGHQQANQQGHNDVHAVYKSHHTADRCKLQQRGQEPSCGRQRRQAGFSGRPTGFACHASLRTLSCAQQPRCPCLCRQIPQPPSSLRPKPRPSLPLNSSSRGSTMRQS